MWCAKYCVSSLCLHEISSYHYFILLVRLWKVRSVTAQCYVSMSDSSRALSQRLFGDQCCWKNFSLWRKQTAHWLCSLLSGFINRPLTTLPLSPPFNCPLKLSTSKQVLYWPTGGHKKIHTDTKAPSLPMSFMHPNKQTHITHRVTWTCEVVFDFCFMFCKQHGAWKSHLANSSVWSHLLEFAPTGKGQRSSLTLCAWGCRLDLLKGPNSPALEPNCSLM